MLQNINFWEQHININKACLCNKVYNKKYSPGVNELQPFKPKSTLVRYSSAKSILYQNDEYIKMM